MENFVVSARKYRPASFDMVVGQSHITTTLKNAIKNNHLAQAFLFCGPRGVGKTTCARILAKTINCTSLTAEGEACNECESCKSFNTQSSFNIHELDAASNNSVDDIRNLVDQVRFPPQSGKYKIYIIDEVHMLSSAAFNAFLKTLEEPPAYAKFILATTEKHKILPTILSRCQIYDFNRIGTRDMAEHLSYIAKKESIKAEDEALNLIAQKADGGLRDALSMFDLIVTYSSGNEVSYAQTIANLHILDYDYYFKATDAIYNEEMTTTLLLFDEILKNGFDGHNFILGLTEHFRNLLVCKDPATVKLLEVSETIQKKYLDQAKAIPDSFLLTAINIANQCDINYKVSKNQRLHVELALMKLVHIKNAVQLAQSMLSGVDLKKKADSVATAAPAQKSSEQAAGPVISDRFRVSTPTAKAVSPQPVVKLKSINAIKEEIESGKSVQSIASGVEEPETVSRSYASEVFTPEALLAVWQELAELKKKAGKMTEFTILDREYKLEGTKIHLHVENALLQEDFMSFRHELLDFLRSRLNNGTIDVSADVATVANTRPVLFNSTEKFRFLAEKYPILEDLQRRLGLELDY